MFHRDVAFKMATDADGITTLRIELCWMHGRCLAACRDVLLRISMAGLRR